MPAPGPLPGLIDVGVLRRRGVRGAAEGLVDRAVLFGVADRLGARAQDVGCGRGLDRCGDVQVRGGGQVDRRGQIQAQVDVGVDVEQGQHFLVRKRDGVLGLDLCFGYALVHRLHYSSIGFVVNARPIPAKPGGRLELRRPDAASNPKILFVILE